MSIRLLILFAVLAAFAVLSAVALMEVGYIGILESHTVNWGTRQVFVDLVIVAILACVWMVDDARKRGANPWPFVLITLIAGSFGPLLYLIARELRAPAGTGAHA